MYSYEDPGGDYDGVAGGMTSPRGARLCRYARSREIGRAAKAAGVKAVWSAIFETNDGFRIFANL